MVALLSMHHLSSPRSATRPSTKDGAVTSIQQARAARPAHANTRRTSKPAASHYGIYFCLVGRLADVFAPSLEGASPRETQHAGGQRVTPTTLREAVPDPIAKHVLF